MPNQLNLRTLSILGLLGLCPSAWAITPEEIEARGDVVAAPVLEAQEQLLPDKEAPQSTITQTIIIQGGSSPEDPETYVVLPEPISSTQTRAEVEPEPEVEEEATPAPRSPSASAVPAGFEAFLAEQTTLVDVYFGGRYVYSGLATFDPQFITFADPEDLLNSIPGLSNTTELLSIVSGPMFNNEGEKCIVEFQSNCGFLETDNIDLIFDPATYQATVFVAPQYLSLQRQQVSRFLPESTAGLSFLQTLNVTATGNDRTDEITQNFNGRTLIGVGGSNVQITSNYSNTSEFEIDDFAWQKDAAGVRYAAGLMSNDRENLDFANQFDLIGVSVGTNLNTREDLRLTTGNRIQIFLPTRSRVSIYKDGRLFSTEVLEAGNQELDTSNLPGGSYEVELRIDDGSGERIETRFYSKNSRLPPADEAQYSITLGQFRNTESDSILDTIDETVLSASYLRRTGDNSALRIGGLATENTGLLEAGWFQATPIFEIEVGGSVTSEEDYGISADIVTSIFGATLTADYRQVWNENSTPIIDESTLLSETSRQIGANLNLPLFNGGLNLSARLNRRENDDRETYSINYRFAPFRLGSKSTLSPRFQYTQQNGLDTFLFTLTFQADRDSWRISQASEYENRETSIGQSEESIPVRVNANWTSPDTWKSLAQVGFDAGRQSDESSNIGANVDWRGSFGKAVFNLDQNLASADKQLSWGGSYHTSVVMTESTWGYGGRMQNNAAIIVDLKEVDAEDVYFDVMVNNRSRGTADPGTTTIVTLPPYETYDVRLAARGLGFVSMIDRTETVTLYPGNAERLVWEIEQIDIVFGRILDSQNNPISGALVGGVEGLAVTDDQGNFQAELSSLTTELTAETRTHQCTVGVPEYEAEDGIGFLGDIRCNLTPKAGASTQVANIEVSQPSAAEAIVEADLVVEETTTILPLPETEPEPSPSPVREQGTLNSGCPVSESRRVLQFAAFASEETAESILEQLRLPNGSIEIFTPENSDQTLYRVIDGPYEESKEELQDLALEFEVEKGWKPWVRDAICSE